MYEIGEKVLFKELNDQQQLGGWDSRWSEGIWVGFDLATYQSIIATSEGRVKANTIKQLPSEGRWDREEIEGTSIKPWEGNKATAGPSASTANVKVLEFFPLRQRGHKATRPRHGHRLRRRK